MRSTTVLALAASCASTVYGFPLLGLGDGGNPLLDLNADVNVANLVTAHVSGQVGGSGLVQAHATANVANVVKACADVEVGDYPDGEECGKARPASAPIRVAPRPTPTPKPAPIRVAPPPKQNNNSPKEQSPPKQNTPPKENKPKENKPSPPKQNNSNPPKQNPKPTCPIGFTFYKEAGSCERNNPIRLAPQPVKPKDKQCPIGLQLHPLLDLCIDVDIDIIADLGISGPHKLWDELTDSCPGNWKQHPSLLSICIDPLVNFELDLGLGGRRPDMYQKCQDGWRKHSSIVNLCLDVNLDVDIFGGHLGRKYGADNRCTAGWNRHPTVAGLCVDAALDIKLFSDERPSKNGSCDQGYKRHASLLDLCLDLDLGLLGGSDNAPNKPAQNNAKQQTSQSKDAAPLAVVEATVDTGKSVLAKVDATVGGGDKNDGLLGGLLKPLGL